MTRWFGTAALLGGLFLIASPGCGDEGIGDPCIPEQEFDTSFNGFDEKQVIAESKSFQCRTRLCLVNHFRGRVSCPYGQDREGNPRNGSTKKCTIPGSTTTVDGLLREGDPNSFADPTNKQRVQPQCVDRSADKAVYCSCRCADINGNKPSDQVFCDCPDGFTCERLIKSVARGNEGLTGSYCVKNNTQFDEGTFCKDGECDLGDPNRKCGDP